MVGKGVLILPRVNQSTACSHESMLDIAQQLCLYLGHITSLFLFIHQVALLKAVL